MNNTPFKARMTAERLKQIRGATEMAIKNAGNAQIQANFGLKPEIAKEMLDEIDALTEQLGGPVTGVSVHGTIGCLNCETGRVTIYAKNRWCFGCLEKKEVAK